MFPVCNSWIVRHEAKGKADLFLKAKLLDLFPAGAGAVNVCEKWQSLCDAQANSDTSGKWHSIILMGMTDFQSPRVKKVQW